AVSGFPPAAPHRSARGRDRRRRRRACARARGRACDPRCCAWACWRILSGTIELAMPERFDAIVIGADQAGPALCARLDQEGLKTALIERKLLGGTCVNNGCIPTKTLIASARAAHVARRGSDYGFSAGSVRVDMPAVKKRKDTVVKQSSDRLERWIAGMRNVSLVR